MPVIIDDIDASVALLSDLGKTILAPAYGAIQTVVTGVAREKGWQNCSYDEFRAWACNTVDGANNWLVLDPLLAATSTISKAAKQMRLRRALEGDRWVVQEVDTSALDGSPTMDFALIDDAAATGDTLEYAARQIHRTGGRVSKIALCITSVLARRRLSSLLPGTEWVQFAKVDDVAIHLRDACPFMPFSGRPVAGRQGIQTRNGIVEVRLPSASLRVGPWPLIYADFRVVHVITQARLSIARALTESLSRPATVGDLRLLGDSVCLPLYSHQNADDTTPLSVISRGM